MDSKCPFSFYKFKHSVAHNNIRPVPKVLLTEDENSTGNNNYHLISITCTNDKVNISLLPLIMDSAALVSSYYFEDWKSYKLHNLQCFAPEIKQHSAILCSTEKILNTVAGWFIINKYAWQTLKRAVAFCCHLCNNLLSFWLLCIKLWNFQHPLNVA